MARVLAFRSSQTCAHRHWMLLKAGLVCRACGLLRTQKPHVVPFQRYA